MNKWHSFVTLKTNVCLNLVDIFIQSTSITSKVPDYGSLEKKCCHFYSTSLSITTYCSTTMLRQKVNFKKQRTCLNQMIHFQNRMSKGVKCLGSCHLQCTVILWSTFSSSFIATCLIRHWTIFWFICTVGVAIRLLETVNVPSRCFTVLVDIFTESDKAPKFHDTSAAGLILEVVQVAKVTLGRPAIGMASTVTLTFTGLVAVDH